MRTPRTPERFTDETGAQLVRVPLANNAGAATLDADDYDRLAAQGLPSQWFLNLNGASGLGYVKVSIDHDNVRVVARAIMEAGRKMQVSYRDGDRLNLRRSNLRLTYGGLGRYEVGARLARAQKIAAWQEGGKEATQAPTAETETSARPSCYAVTVDDHDGALWASVESAAEHGTGLIVSWPDGPAAAAIHCNGPHGPRVRVIQFPEGFATGAPAVALICGTATRLAIRKGTDGAPRSA